MNSSKIAVIMAVLRSVVVSFLWSAAVLSAFAQPSAPHARVELLSRQETMAAGAPAQLGVHFVLEPGWHIYWINPGDSGQPPSFKWRLPYNFSAGEIQWPRPERLQPSKELVDYGYDNEVLLPLTIHTSPNSSVSKPLEFSVEVKWLVCREVCIPEHADLHLSLPMGTTATLDQKHVQLFTKTDKTIPQFLPHSWNASVTSAKDDLILTVRAGKPITKAIFFPLDPGQVDNAAPQKLQPSRTGATLTLKKSDFLLKPISVLRGVLVISGGPAYRIEAPVRQSIQ